MNKKGVQTEREKTREGRRGRPIKTKKGGGGENVKRQVSEINSFAFMCTKVSVRYCRR